MENSILTGRITDYHIISVVLCGLSFPLYSETQIHVFFFVDDLYVAVISPAES